MYSILEYIGISIPLRIDKFIVKYNNMKQPYEVRMIKLINIKVYFRKIERNIEFIKQILSLFFYQCNLMFLNYYRMLCQRK